MIVGMAIGMIAVSRGVVHGQAQPPVAQAAPTITPTAALPPNAVVVTLAFKTIQQGRAGLLTIDGANLASATANALARQYTCFPTQKGLACLIAVPIDQAIKDYPLSLTITTQGGATLPWSSTFTVTSGGFVAETFALPSALNYLLHDDVQANENDRLLAAYSIITPARYWEGAFTPPVNSVSTSPFGALRTENGVTTRHTGQDFRATPGTPVFASASGRVVLSRLMDIHGNNIVIDHGWGIYTEYAHLSERYVVPGQFVLQGQLIGLSGNTGRSSGPHVHWEVAVDDVWVDPLDFAQIQLPP